MAEEGVGLEHAGESQEELTNRYLYEAGFVELINRTSKILWACVGGRSIKLRPGRNVVSPTVAVFARRQNPVMGTDDDFGDADGAGEKLVGVAAWGDPVEPLEQSEAPSRTKLPELGETKVIDQYGRTMGKAARVFEPAPIRKSELQGSGMDTLARGRATIIDQSG